LLFIFLYSLFKYCLNYNSLDLLQTIACLLLSTVFTHFYILFEGEAEVEVEVETEVEVKIETEVEDETEAEAGDPSQARDDNPII